MRIISMLKLIFLNKYFLSKSLNKIEELQWANFSYKKKTPSFVKIEEKNTFADRTNKFSERIILKMQKTPKNVNR